MTAFQINEISAVDDPAQEHAKIVFTKNSTRKEFRKMQTQNDTALAMAPLNKAAAAIKQRDNCSGTKALRKARLENPELFEGTRFIEVEKRQPICGSVRKSAEEVQFESLVKQIVTTEKVKPTDAMIIARKRYPSEFAKAYG
jgi:hypothetical protein